MSLTCNRLKDDANEKKIGREGGEREKEKEREKEREIDFLDQNCEVIMLKTV